MNTNGIVYIADGIYNGPNNRDINIGKNMSIIGQSQTGTIIDAEKQSRFFRICDVSLILQNMTLKNGYDSNDGGAIEISAFDYRRSNLAVTNCTFINNSARDGGAIATGVGALYSGYPVATCTVTGCTFTNNQATYGGAIYNGCDIEASPFSLNCMVIGSTFTNNQATYGGAIHNSCDNDGGDGSVDCIANFNRFYNNTAATGDAICNWSGSVDAENNWWGTNNPISDFPSLINGAAAPTQWLFMTINATPNTINNTETSLVTVSFNNYSSDGTTYTEFDPSLGHIPDGTPVTFSLTNGPFGTLTPPLTVNTLSGIASILFTASNVGVQDVNATLDDQNVTTSITILAAHVDLDTFYADYDEFINNNHNIVPITGPVNYLDHIIVVFTATNMGPNPVTDLVLREDWPSELTGTGDVWHTFDGINWILDSYLAQGSFNLYPTYDGPLDVGDVCLVVFGATVNASNTIITNTVSTTEQEPIDDEGFDTASADLEVNPEVNVTITKTANNTRPNVGETVVFTIVATNNGPDTANNLVVTDTLPAGLDFVSCTDGGVWDPVTRTVTWPSAVVLNGANVTYYLTALVNSTILAGTNVTNVVNETHTEYPYNSTTNCTIYVPKADLYIQISSDKNNPIVGEIFTLTYKLGNNGPDDAENVTITIPIPEGFHISSITGDGTWNMVGNNIIWTFNNVTVGDPYLYITGWTTRPGIYLFSASIASETFSINSMGVNSLNINSKPQVNAATTNTVGMQKTGIPIAGIVLAILMVLGGFIGTLKK